MGIRETESSRGPKEIGEREKEVFATQVGTLINQTKELPPGTPTSLLTHLHHDYVRYKQNDKEVKLCMPRQERVSAIKSISPKFSVTITTFLFWENERKVFKEKSLLYTPDPSLKENFTYNEKDLVYDLKNKLIPEDNMPTAALLGNEFPDLKFSLIKKNLKGLDVEKKLGMHEVTPQRYQEFMNVLSLLKPSDVLPLPSLIKRPKKQ